MVCNATIAQAGRLVLPKALRDQVGLRAGEVNVFADGAGLRVEPIATEALEEREDRLVVARSGLEVKRRDGQDTARLPTMRTMMWSLRR